jgi:putative tricarboxylic transport membrane protein
MDLEQPAARSSPPAAHQPAVALLGCTSRPQVCCPASVPATAVAMLLPITAKVDLTASMIFAGIYYGAMYGGSTTSILLNTPGESGSMVTAMEGNKMAKSGRAGAALATAAIGSFVAGTIATVLVTFFAPLVANYAVLLGPPEYFLLMVLAFCTVSAVLGKSTLRGITALFGRAGAWAWSGWTRSRAGALHRQRARS